MQTEAMKRATILCEAFGVRALSLLEAADGTIWGAGLETAGHHRVVQIPAQGSIDLMISKERYASAELALEEAKARMKV
jgi:hypothetical protein